MSNNKPSTFLCCEKRKEPDSHTFHRRHLNEFYQSATGVWDDTAPFEVIFHIHPHEAIAAHFNKKGNQIYRTSKPSLVQLPTWLKLLATSSTVETRPKTYDYEARELIIKPSKTITD